MNCIKLLMALIVACILIMPAYSMPDYGMGQDSKQKICDCQCDCLKLKVGQDDKPMWPGQDGKQMMQGMDDKPKTCGCPASMMDRDDKPIMQVKDDKPMWPGQDGKQMMQGMDDRPKTCGGPASMMDQDDKKMEPGHDGKQVKSMMGHDGNDHMGHKQIKSMMGDREKGDNGSVKVVIVNVHV